MLSPMPNLVARKRRDASLRSDSVQHGCALHVGAGNKNCVNIAIGRHNELDRGLINGVRRYPAYDLIVFFVEAG